MIKARIIFNDYIPIKGFKGITIYPRIFVRKDVGNWTPTYTRHETTHLLQQEEVLILAFSFVSLGALIGLFSLWWLLLVPFVFYMGYGLEWLIRLPFNGFDKELAYKNISTEQEAYLYQEEYGYNNGRKPFYWIHFLFKKSFKRDELTGKIVKIQ